MKATGLRLAVATSASPEELEALLAIVRAGDLFDVKIDCIMVGDTPYDAAAARSAGARFIGLRCGGWRGAELQPAIAVYSGPAELLKVLEKKAESAALRLS